MQSHNRYAQTLATALGTPKYYIDTPGLQKGEFYSWFPNVGDSMTDGTAKSIPSGSLVLGRLLQLNDVMDIPLHQPIVIIINDEGEQFCMLKTACRIIGDAITKDNSLSEICLRSYNPASRCDDFWIPFNCIKFVFVVERVRLPDGSEFVPQQEKVTRRESK